MKDLHLGQGRGKDGAWYLSEDPQEDLWEESLRLPHVWPAIYTDHISSQTVSVLEVAACDASIVLYQFFWLSTLLTSQLLIEGMSEEVEFYVNVLEDGNSKAVLP